MGKGASNCHFSYDAPFTFFETTVDIQAHTSQELFVSYGILGYWIPKVQAAPVKEPLFANDFLESLHQARRDSHRWIHFTFLEVTLLSISQKP